MSSGNEIMRAFWSTLAEISCREKMRSLDADDYGDAIIAGILEGVFREAVKRV